MFEVKSDVGKYMLVIVYYTINLLSVENIPHHTVYAKPPQWLVKQNCCVTTSVNGITFYIPIEPNDYTWIQLILPLHTVEGLISKKNYIMVFSSFVLRLFGLCVHLHVTVFITSHNAEIPCDHNYLALGKNYLSTFLDLLEKTMSALCS